MDRKEIAEKQKTISRNHWMFRLHRYCWNFTPKYEGYCPLFWTSIFNISVLPLVVVGKVVEGGIKLLIDLVPERAKVAPVVKQFSPDDEDIVSMFEDPSWYESWNWFNTYSYKENLEYWVMDNPNWKELYPAAKEREKVRLAALQEQAAREEEQAKKNRLRKERLQAKMDKIVSLAQYFVKPALAASAIFAAYLVYQVVGWFISIFSFSVFCEVLMYLGIVALFVLGCYGLFKLIKVGANLVKFEKEVIQENKNPGIFSKIGGFIGEALEFIENTIDIIYKKKCPLVILTDDETRPIEKISKGPKDGI